MPTRPADCHRLTLLIQRMLDADALCEAQGRVLLTATEAARHLLERGDAEAARQYVVRVVRLTETLIGTEAITQAEGQAVLETAHRLLAGNTD